MPSNKLSSLQSCWEYLAATWTWSYTKLDPNHMAHVGTVGLNGEEIPVSIVYGQVELAAKYSQQDCKLDNLWDGIEEEYNQSDWLYKNDIKNAF